MSGGNGTRSNGVNSTNSDNISNKISSTNSNTLKTTSNSSNPDLNSPITNETVPKDQRIKKLRKKNKGPNPLKLKLWLGGHISTIIFGTISIIFQLLKLPNRWYINSICYRLALLGSISSLIMTTSRRYGHFLPPISGLLAHQNFQYAILSVIWLFTFKSIFKLLPYYILSILHLCKYANLSVVINHSHVLAGVIAYDELFLILYLFIRTLCFQNTSGFQLIAFYGFYWLRILYNKQTTALFSTIIEKVDLLNIKNPKFQKYWGRFKELIAERRQEGE